MGTARETSRYRDSKSYTVRKEADARELNSHSVYFGGEVYMVALALTISFINFPQISRRSRKTAKLSTSLTTKSV